MAVYEFPLNEKIRNYLRIEDIMATILLTAKPSESRLQIQFFEHLFTLLELIERIDIRADVVRDLDAHERNLVYWSQHPKIDDDALNTTLQAVIRLRDTLKTGKKPGTDLKTDVFLQSIRQRFAIPGATCSFDLPNMHFWLNQPEATRKADIDQWLESVNSLYEAIVILLSFSRQQAPFSTQIATNGFYQGDSENTYGLIRIKMPEIANAYPTLSGNKYRYALRFMHSTKGQAVPVESDINFDMAACK